jgi:hypothetical protein
LLSLSVSPFVRQNMCFASELVFQYPVAGACVLSSPASECGFEAFECLRFCQIALQASVYLQLTLVFDFGIAAGLHREQMKLGMTYCLGYVRSRLQRAGKIAYADVRLFSITHLSEQYNSAFI